LDPTAFSFAHQNYLVRYPTPLASYFCLGTSLCYLYLDSSSLLSPDHAAPPCRTRHARRRPKLAPRLCPAMPTAPHHTPLDLCCNSTKSSSSTQSCSLLGHVHGASLEQPAATRRCLGCRPGRFTSAWAAPALATRPSAWVVLAPGPHASSGRSLCSSAWAVQLPGLLRALPARQRAASQASPARASHRSSSNWPPPGRAAARRPGAARAAVLSRRRLCCSASHCTQLP